MPAGEQRGRRLEAEAAAGRRRWIERPAQASIQSSVAASACCSVASTLASTGEGDVSVYGGETFEDATLHCSGARVTSHGWRRVDHASLRTRSRAADVGALYDGFDAVGLQYGPGYRTLTQAWSGGDASGSLVRTGRARASSAGLKRLHVPAWELGAYPV